MSTVLIVLNREYAAQLVNFTINMLY